MTTTIIPMYTHMTESQVKCVEID